MISKKILGSSAGGMVLGVSQTALLREFVDKPMAKSYLATNPTSTSPAPFLMKQLKNFGSPSAVIGIASGAIATGIGTYGSLKGRPMDNNSANIGLTSYGISALTTGVYSGIFPTVEWSAGVATDPSNPIFTGFGRRQRSSALESPAGQGAVVGF